MRLIPVLDLMAGRAVRAVGGARANYRPLRSTLVPEVGDAEALARAYQERLECRELYVADLDAIGGGAPQSDLVRALSRVGPALLVDAGVTAVTSARVTLTSGVARVVVGLETLQSFQSLEAIVGTLGPRRVVFSLDLRAGQPVVKRGWAGARQPLALAADAVRCGVNTMLLLDLGRVGTGAGLDLSLLRAMRAAHPALELLAGGGVGSRRDLELAREAGCDGALVASALHDGRLGAGSLHGARGAASRRHDHRKDSR